MPPCYEAVIRPNMLSREPNGISDEAQRIKVFIALHREAFNKLKLLRPLAVRELFMFRLQLAPLDEAMGCDQLDNTRN